MSIQEQQECRRAYYQEAIRYMDNAKETLQKACKEGNFYNDRKYVKTACGTAYNGVLTALDGYFLTKGIEKPKKNRRTVAYYQEHIAQWDKKLLQYFNSVYETLHLWGYYDGILNATIIKAGFDDAYTVIGYVKPLDA